MQQIIVVDREGFVQHVERDVPDAQLEARRLGIALALAALERGEEITVVSVVRAATPKGGK